MSANVMDRSIGIDNPCLSWTDISQANTVSFESDYGCPGLDTCKGIHSLLVLRTKMLYEVSCIAVIFPLSEDHFNMSNSDELRHTDNTTLVPPRLPDTLPQVYYRRRPTLGLLILPSVSPFPPIIRRTARISILPIEPNHPTQREEALTETGQNSVPVPEIALTVCTTRLRGQLHTVLEDMDRYPNACLEDGIDTHMLNQLIATRVAEALAATAVTHAASTQEDNNLGSNFSQNKTCNYKEFRAVMHENFCGIEGVVGLTRWFEKLESQFGICNIAEGDRVKFASSTLLDGTLTWWNVYFHSVTLDTAHATP
ncbi:hypothetical protein Tco_0233716 [Tanacetum coccineum]